MDKPNWEDAPENAKFLAQDSDGDWYWWTGRPKVVDPLGYWMPNEGEQEIAALIQDTNQNVCDWKESLEPRP